MIEKHIHYGKLLKMLFRVIEASKGTIVGTDDRILDAEGLALKFFGHASAVFYLHQGTALPLLDANFVDPSSINVLGRAALETFLVFHHVFVDPATDDERDFRYMSWLLAGLLERQTFPVHSPKGKEMLSKEAQLIAPVKVKLEKNQCLNALTPGQRKDLLEKGKWKLPSWKEMALSSGLSRTHAETFYSYLCGYAHAGNLSVRQIRNAQTLQSQQALCAATIGELLISTANMIRAYCKVFPKSESSLEQDQDGTELVNMWIEIGATPTNKVEFD